MKKSILFLLSLCLIFGVAQKSFASPTEEEQQAAVDTLKKLMAIYKTDADGKIVFFDLTDQVCTNDDLAKICKLSDVTEAKIYGANLKPGGAEVMKGLAACKKLSIENTDFVDADMAVLAEMPWVEELTLRRNTYQGVETLSYVAKMPKLRNLVLLYGNFNDDAVLQLADVKTLRLLDLRGCSAVTDRGLGVLKELPNLIVVKLRCTAVTNLGVENVRGKKLKTFDIQDSQMFDDKAVEILLEMADSLQELTIMRCIALSNEGVKKMTALKNVRRLNLRGNSLGDSGMAGLAGMRDLELVCLSETYVKDDGMKHLEGMDKIKTLDLWHTKVGDAGLDVIGKLTSLTSLSLMTTRVTDAGVKKLTGLTNLTHLNLNETSITNESVETLSQMKSLKTLCVKSTMLTNKGIRELKEALPGCVVED